MKIRSKTVKKIRPYTRHKNWLVLAPGETVQFLGFAERSGIENTNRRKIKWESISTMSI